MVTSAEEIGQDTRLQEDKVCHEEASAEMARVVTTPEVAREVVTPEMAQVEAPTPCCHKRRGDQRGTRRQMSLHSHSNSQRGAPK